MLMIPALTTVNDRAFLADDTLIGGYELGGGWLRIERVKIGKRAFVGNSGMAAPGRKVPKRALVAVLSAAPRRKTAKAGDVLARQPARRAAAYRRDGRRRAAPTRPPPGCGWPGPAGRWPGWSRCWSPSCLYAAVGAGRAGRPRRARRPAGCCSARSRSGLVAVRRAWPRVVTTAAKWLLVGRMRPGSHPLWSSFVWRNELADTFVEVVAAPWFARAVTGTPC